MASRRVRAGLAVVAAMTGTMLLVGPRPVAAQEGVGFSMVHGLPGITIDVVAGGEVIADDVSPGAVLDLDAYAGAQLVDLAVVSSTDSTVLVGPVASFDVPATGDWAIVAHLDDDGEPTLTTFQNDVSPVSPGTTRFTLRHTAAATPIDLEVGDNRPIVNLANGMGATISLSTGALDEARVATRGGPVIADLPSLALAANSMTVVYVTGSVADGTVGFVVQTIELEPPSAVTTRPSDATSTSVASMAPTIVNTGAPLDDSLGSLAGLLVIGGIALAGTAWAARRRV